MLTRRHTQLGRSNHVGKVRQVNGKTHNASGSNPRTETTYFHNKNLGSGIIAGASAALWNPVGTRFDSVHVHYIWGAQGAHDQRAEAAAWIAYAGEISSRFPNDREAKIVVVTSLFCAEELAPGSTAGFYSQRVIPQSSTNNVVQRGEKPPFTLEQPVSIDPHVNGEDDRPASPRHVRVDFNDNAGFDGDASIFDASFGR